MRQDGDYGGPSRGMHRSLQRLYDAYDGRDALAKVDRLVLSLRARALSSGQRLSRFAIQKCKRNAIKKDSGAANATHLEICQALLLSRQQGACLSTGRMQSIIVSSIQC